jgi:hypothetical protein
MGDLADPPKSPYGASGVPRGHKPRGSAGKARNTPNPEEEASGPAPAAFGAAPGACKFSRFRPRHNAGWVAWVYYDFFETFNLLDIEFEIKRKPDA